MTDLDQRILDKVNSIFGEEQLASAIVYVDRAQIHAGTSVKLGDSKIEAPWDAYIAFVDLEPKANWGHACCYLAIRRDADDVIKVSARMPPFLKGETSGFRLLWRGSLAPKWAVMTDVD